MSPTTDQKDLQREVTSLDLRASLAVGEALCNVAQEEVERRSLGTEERVRDAEDRLFKKRAQEDPDRARVDILRETIQDIDAVRHAQWTGCFYVTTEATVRALRHLVQTMYSGMWERIVREGEERCDVQDL